MAPSTEYLKRSHSRGIAIFSYPTTTYSVSMIKQTIFVNFVYEKNLYRFGFLCLVILFNMLLNKTMINDYIQMGCKLNNCNNINNMLL